MSLAPLSASINKLENMSKNSNTPKSELREQKQIVKKRLFSLSKRGKKWATVSILVAATLGTLAGYSRTDHAKITAAKHLLARASGYNTRTTGTFLKKTRNNAAKQGHKLTWRNVRNLPNEYRKHPKLVSTALTLTKWGF